MSFSFTSSFLSAQFRRQTILYGEAVKGLGRDEDDHLIDCLLWCWDHWFRFAKKSQKFERDGCYSKPLDMKMPKRMVIPILIMKQGLQKKLSLVNF